LDTKAEFLYLPPHSNFSSNINGISNQDNRSLLPTGFKTEEANVFSVGVPEFKTEMCYNPRLHLSLPCLYTREKNHSIVAIVQYPAALETAIKAYVLACLAAAVKAAYAVISVEFTVGVGVGGGFPAGIATGLTAAVAAIPEAYIAAQTAFWACITPEKVIQEIAIGYGGITAFQGNFKFDIIHRVGRPTQWQKR
jgi:hypothetical protein